MFKSMEGRISLGKATKERSEPMRLSGGVYVRVMSSNSNGTVSTKPVTKSALLTKTFFFAWMRSCFRPRIAWLRMSFLVLGSTLASAYDTIKGISPDRLVTGPTWLSDHAVGSCMRGFVSPQWGENAYIRRVVERLALTKRPRRLG